MGFVLDERLESSSFLVEDWTLCRVLLKTDKTWPWLYLVPRRENIREIYELNLLDQVDFIREVTMAAQALKILYKADKINTAALGNMVPQLHVHVFARYTTDLAWPQPVWAVQTGETPYTDHEKKAEIQKLKKCFEGLRRGDKTVCHQ